MADEPTFDALYVKLEETTRRLEEGNLGLEASVGLYEEGAELVLKLREILSAAELRITRVQERLSDTPRSVEASDAPADYDDTFEYADEE